MVPALFRAYLKRVHESALRADREPALAQARVHRALSHGLVGTRAGLLQPLPAYESLEHYRKHVRLTGHEDYAALIARAMSHPAPGYFERGITADFGHTSSGTRYIPFTRAHVAAFREFQLEAAAEIGFGAGVAEIFEGRSFMIQGNLEAWRSPAGPQLGYSSAIMLARTPRVLRRRLRPRVETLRCPALDERIERIGEELLEARPRILAGIPEYVAGILASLLSGPRAPAIAEALRGVALYGWSGSPIGPYRSFFEGLFAPGCVFLDAVSATEGALGIRCARTGRYRFAFDRSLLLFVTEDGDRLFAWELEPGQEAQVILGSPAGLLGYRTGDRIRLLSRDPLRFELLSRARAHALGGFEGEVSSLLARTSGDYYLYLDPVQSRLEAVLEADAAPAEPAMRALAARSGCREVSVRVLPRGRICRAGLRASAAGLTKLPRFNRDPRVHDLIARHL